MLECDADQIKGRRDDEALDDGAACAEVDRDAQILDPSSGQLKELLSLSTRDLSGLLKGAVSMMGDQDEAAGTA
jgi:hypothetical protein